MKKIHSTENPGSSKHRWKFFRAGGFDQVFLGSGADLMSLDRLHQKLWVALSCPTQGLEFDSRTLEMIDTDRDGHIRVPEILNAVRWAGTILKNPEDLLKRSPSLPLAAINDRLAEGKQLLDSAKRILINLDRPDAQEIALDDMADIEKMIAGTRFNGDGIVPAEAAEDPALRQIINDIMDCFGSERDRGGLPGISREKQELFFAEAQAYSEWHREAEDNAPVVLPFGEATVAAAAAFNTVQAKIDDYFTRCRLAAFDCRSLNALNRREEEYLAIAENNLAPSLEEVSGFPLARIEGDKALPLKEGINPAWKNAMAMFEEHVLKPLGFDEPSLTEAQWESIRKKFTAYTDWLSRKAGAAVERLGLDRIREILEGNAEQSITELIAQDKALETEFSNIGAVEKLIRYHRDLFGLLNNFVSFGDFYSRKKAIFQAGTLYLDGRSCELCVRVDDIDKHAALASLSRIHLTYCVCRRNEETMTIAAAFTGGDSDFLLVGRNGVFYDRKGQDWDAVIVKIIENPISIRQAFWSPYKQLAAMIGKQIEKIAAARDRAAMEKAAVRVSETGANMASGKPAPPPPPQAPAFDVAKFAGIFAAIGMAVGFIGSAIVSVATGFFKLAWWQMPLVVAGIILVISLPSVILAWLKLRRRTLGPILDANGWAVNARVKINMAFGGSLTKLAALPEGASRSLEDPFADKKSPWPKAGAAAGVLLVIGYLLYYFGLFGKWIAAVMK